MSHPNLSDTTKDLNREILTWIARPGVFLPQAPLPPVEVADGKDRFRVSDFRLGDKERIGESEAQRLDYQLAVKGQDPTFSVAVWLDTATGLPVKRVLVCEVGTEKTTVVETYQKLTLDEKVDAKLFKLLGQGVADANQSATGQKH